MEFSGLMKSQSKRHVQGVNQAKSSPSQCFRTWQKLHVLGSCSGTGEVGTLKAGAEPGSSFTQGSSGSFGSLSHPCVLPRFAEAQGQVVVAQP